MLLVGRSNCIAIKKELDYRIERGISAYSLFKSLLVTLKNQFAFAHTKVVMVSDYI
jgi:hypothetical protein